MAAIMGFSGFGSKKKWQIAVVEHSWTITWRRKYSSKKIATESYRYMIKSEDKWTQIGDK